jgi:phosphate transport system protein
MQTYLDELLQRDIDRIRMNVKEMAQLAENALQDCIKSMVEGNRQVAYAVILRDYYIDEKEKEIDRLCLEFIVHQQPVALPLRFAYSTIKINLEIERVGDYAESIARQLVKLKKPIPDNIKNDIIDMAKLSIVMFQDATRAFLEQNVELAKKNIIVDETVDALRVKCNSNLVSLFLNQQISYDVLESMTNIVRRFERVSDQARNICLEALYMCTGENPKHPGAGSFRILFLDDHNSCQSQIAETFAQAMNQPRFIFTSAGLDPQPVDKATIKFMKSKGFDLSRIVPRSLHSIPNLEYYDVIVALSTKALKTFPYVTRKAIVLDWTLEDPSKARNSDKSKEAAYEEVYQSITSHLNDLVGAIIGSEIK